MCVDSIADCFHAAAIRNTGSTTVKKSAAGLVVVGGFKGMPPEIALNRLAYLRLYRERHEKNHSPLQVQVAPASVPPHVW